MPNTHTQADGNKFTLVRDVKAGEFRFLGVDLPKGTHVYHQPTPTHMLSQHPRDGFFVSLDPDGGPLFEVLYDALFLPQPGKTLDGMGRCCGRKPLEYKRPPRRFCTRCHASFDFERGVQIASAMSGSYKALPDGMFLRNFAYD